MSQATDGCVIDKLAGRCVARVWPLAELSSVAPFARAMADRVHSSSAPSYGPRAYSLWRFLDRDLTQRN
jgi:hypothetical protein